MTPFHILWGYVLSPPPPHLLSFFSSSQLSFSFPSFLFLLFSSFSSFPFLPLLFSLVFPLHPSSFFPSLPPSFPLSPPSSYSSLLSSTLSSPIYLTPPSPFPTSLFFRSMVSLKERSWTLPPKSAPHSYARFNLTYNTPLSTERQTSYTA